MSGFPLESMKRNWRTWPNLLSSLRILASWLPAYLLVTGSYNNDTAMRWWALGLFVFIAATDGLDGWLARRLKQTSEWGMFIDPIGDKLLVGFSLIAVYWVNWDSVAGAALAIAVWVMFAREFILAAQIRRVQGRVVPPTFGGKVKTVVQFAFLIIWMLPIFDSSYWLLGFSLGLAVFYTVQSWFEYYRLYVRRSPLPAPVTPQETK